MQPQTNQAPAGPVLVDVDARRRALIARLRSNWTMLTLRRSETFAALGRGPWQVFETVARFWTPSSSWAWPSQKKLAEHMGVTERSVRAWSDELVHRGVILRRYETLDDGRTRIYYAPGPATFAALELVAAASLPERASDPPRKQLPTPPETISADLNPNINKEDHDRTGARARDGTHGDRSAAPLAERASPQGEHKSEAPSAPVPSARSHLFVVSSPRPLDGGATERRAMERQEQTADHRHRRSKGEPRALFADMLGAQRVLEALNKPDGGSP